MSCRLWQKVASAAQLGLFALALAAQPQEGSAMPRHPGRDLDGHALSGVNAETFPKWFGAMGRTWAYASTTEAVCRERMRRGCGLDRWHAFLAGLEAKDPLTRLKSVNAFVNRVPYRSDRAVWERSDYWAAPGEFFARGGDCEDYAVAKYFSLRILGFPPESLRIVVLRDTLRRVAHAVLVVRQDGREWVLDNQVAKLVDWREQLRYQPVYAINEDGAWIPAVLKPAT